MRRAHLNVIGFVILCIVIAIGIYRVEQLAHQGEEAHRGLCALKHDLEVRIKTSDDLLKEHEGEATIFGIPRKLIVDGRNNQQRTLDTFRALECET